MRKKLSALVGMFTAAFALGVFLTLSSPTPAYAQCACGEEIGCLDFRASCAQCPGECLFVWDHDCINPANACCGNLDEVSCL